MLDSTVPINTDVFMSSSEFDFDYLIIGSGFGGSVSAMRLAQKGYKVGVIEAGKRWRSEDFPKTNWSVTKYLWFPKVFCYGIQRINLLQHVMILGGAGVGGGSLVYANTLYSPLPRFFTNPTVKKMGGEKSLLPYYDLARKMLGAATNPRLSEVDDYMRETAAEFGKADTFHPTPAAVFFGKPEVLVKDPYFKGEGPDRVGCHFCGGCMVGCRHNAKNTLDKNYLYFAEKLGVTVIPETKVNEVIPLSPDGAAGYELQTVRTTGFFGYPRKTYRAKGVIFSAGVLGTVNLLMRMKEKGVLPNISDSLGSYVRTNSESIVGVTASRKDVDFSKGIAITSSVHPEEETHIEPVRYSKGSDVMGLLATILVDGGGKIPRVFKFIFAVFRHPVDFLRTALPFGFAQRSIILLVMQSIDNSMSLVRKRRWIWPFMKSLTSSHGEQTAPPNYIPAANEFARKLAKRVGGVARSSYNEVLMDIPTTAHILGGACISTTPDEGPIDLQNRVFGYQNMLVCDGSMIPGNLGVNPALSITALAERAMSFIPPKASRTANFNFEKVWKVTGLMSNYSKLAPPAKKKPAAAKKKAKKAARR